METNTRKNGKEVVYSNGLTYITKSIVQSQSQFEAYAISGYAGSFQTLSEALARLNVTI